MDPGIVHLVDGSAEALLLPVVPRPAVHPRAGKGDEQAHQMRLADQCIVGSVILQLGDHGIEDLGGILAGVGEKAELRQAERMQQGGGEISTETDPKIGRAFGRAENEFLRTGGRVQQKTSVVQFK